MNRLQRLAEDLFWEIRNARCDIDYTEMMEKKIIAEALAGYAKEVIGTLWVCKSCGVPYKEKGIFYGEHVNCVSCLAQGRRFESESLEVLGYNQAKKQILHTIKKDERYINSLTE